MRTILGYLQQYFRSIQLPAFIAISLFIAVLITINYTVGIEAPLMNISSYGWRFTGFFLLFAFVFGTSWLVQFFFHRKEILPRPFFIGLLVAAPAIFAVKITFDWFTRLLTRELAVPWNQFGYMVANWPVKCLLVLALVMLIWKWGRYENPVAGMRGKGFDAKPYFILLACMLPLVAFAATRPDFLNTYPKVHRIGFIEPYTQHNVLWQLLYELSYGIDFITIEFFFRGFLVLAFARYAGKTAILPMAAFYCAIHFGKPLFECITSFFGGLILGAVVYNTRSIWGGLIIHLGIAWLMELGAALVIQLRH